MLPHRRGLFSRKNLRISPPLSHNCKQMIHLRHVHTCHSLEPGDLDCLNAHYQYQSPEHSTRIYVKLLKKHQINSPHLGCHTALISLSFLLRFVASSSLDAQRSKTFLHLSIDKEFEFRRTVEFQHHFQTFRSLCSMHAYGDLVNKKTTNIHSSSLMSTITATSFLIRFSNGLSRCLCMNLSFPKQFRILGLEKNSPFDERLKFASIVL